jgi:hypothetical protein
MAENHTVKITAVLLKRRRNGGSGRKTFYAFLSFPKQNTVHNVRTSKKGSDPKQTMALIRLDPDQENLFFTFLQPREYVCAICD